MLKNNKANDALIMLCYTCAFGAFGAFFRWLQMQVARDTETGMINPSILNILLPLLIVAAAVVLWLRTRKLTDAFLIWVFDIAKRSIGSIVCAICEPCPHGRLYLFAGLAGVP